MTIRYATGVMHLDLMEINARTLNKSKLHKLVKLIHTSDDEYAILTEMTEFWKTRREQLQESLKTERDIKTRKEIAKDIAFFRDTLGEIK